MLGMVKAGMEVDAGVAVAATQGKLKPASLQAVVETQQVHDKLRADSWNYVSLVEIRSDILDSSS